MVEARRQHAGERAQGPGRKSVLHGVEVPSGKMGVAQSQMVVVVVVVHNVVIAPHSARCTAHLAKAKLVNFRVCVCFIYL